MGTVAGGLRGVQDAAVEGKTAVVRVDYNVPLADGAVADDARIAASLPTLRYLLDRGAKVVLISHLGRPEGHVAPELRLNPVAQRLQELLGHPVRKLDDCVGEGVIEAVAQAETGDVILLENLRFHPEETHNETAFARQLAGLGNLFVNDAFATLHRSHASTLGIADHLPSYAGMLIQKEIDALAHLTEAPERPYLAVVGGKKARSKLGALRDLSEHVDAILVGGGVAFTFLRAGGIDVGASIVDMDLLDEVRAIAEEADERGVPILLPRDVVVAESVSATAATTVCDVGDIPSGWMGLDIGPETTLAYGNEIASAKTVVWTGPMGAFEFEPFAQGTRAIAERLAASDAFSVVGGGETGEAIARLGVREGISFVSTGGGACLALLRGKRLPALEALRD